MLSAGDLTVHAGNARIAGLEADLHLQGYDYNIILSIFYISYVLFEIPSNVLCKWIGPGWFLPVLSLCFGITSLGTAFVTTKAQICGVRFLLGIFEAGMMPGIAYYLSRWYRRSELAFRLSLYIVMAPLAGAFGGLLASGILGLDHFGSLHSWRMIFGVEGVITIGLSVIRYAVAPVSSFPCNGVVVVVAIVPLLTRRPFGSFFTLTDRPATARWLTEEERDLAIARVKSERVGTTEVLDGLDKNKLVRGILNPITLSTSFIFLLNNVTVQGLAFFAPTIVKTIYPKETLIRQQLYTVPPYVVGGFFVLLFSYLSWRVDRRQIFIALANPWSWWDTSCSWRATYLRCGTGRPF